MSKRSAKRGPVPQPPPPGDLGQITSAAMLHSVVEVSKDANGSRRRRRKGIVERLQARGWINEHHARAATLYLDAYEAAMHAGRDEANAGSARGGVSDGGAAARADLASEVRRVTHGITDARERLVLARMIGQGLWWSSASVAGALKIDVPRKGEAAVRARKAVLAVLHSALVKIDL